MLREVPKGNKGTEQRLRILRTGLKVAPSIGEAFALEILRQLGAAWEALPSTADVLALIEWTPILERGLFLAAHFDCKDHMQSLVSCFHKLLQGQRGNSQAMPYVERVASESLRGLRKVGLRDEIDVLLRHMAGVILNGKDLSTLNEIRTEKSELARLRALLHVASGWLYFGRERQAEPIINAARSLLFSEQWEQKQIKEQSQLARVYARTVGGTSVEIVQKRLEELFQKLTRIRDSIDTLTTHPFYSLLHLDIVEAVVLAIVGEDQTMGANARRWLDDDEFIVRRRIHRDFHAAKKHT
jgi:hypothetical protein